MANVRALIVAIEKPLHAERGGVPSAESDAARFAAAFGAANCTVLAGKFATKAAVESRLRKFKKLVRKGDRAIVVWLGRGHSTNGRGYLNCWDSLPDDPQDTALSVSDLIVTVKSWKVDESLFLLAVPGIDLLELEADPNFVVLLACRPDEEPLASPEIPGGVWSQLVVEAIDGRARKARDLTGSLTARSLQAYIEAELPRRLRRHFDADAAQTPLLLGDGTILDASAANDSDDAILDAGRLRRVVFRSETTAAVRELTEFRKSFSLPTKAGSASRKFVQRLAAADIRSELDRVTELSRERFGYRRRDLTVVAGQDGTGSLRTPDFEFAISVDLDPSDPTRLVWRRELGRFSDLDFARSTEFGAGFGPAYDQLVFELARPLNVVEFVDRLEDSPLPGTKLTLGTDATTCEISLRGFAGTITIARSAVVVRGRTSQAVGLFDLLLEFLTRFGPLGEPLALPPKRT